MTVVVGRVGLEPTTLRLSGARSYSTELPSELRIQCVNGFLYMLNCFVFRITGCCRRRSINTRFWVSICCTIHACVRDLVRFDIVSFVCIFLSHYLLGSIPSFFNLECI